jgi:hypothetical protein
MPDLHAGPKYPIGCAVISSGCIYPELIGGDVGRWSSLEISNQVFQLNVPDFLTFLRTVPIFSS